MNIKQKWFAFGAASIITAALVIALTIPSDKTIYLSPVAGDNWPQIQDAINTQLADPDIPEVVLKLGVFHISKPLIFAKIDSSNGKVFRQVTPKFRGWVNAKNTPDDKSTVIQKDFADGPGIGVQLAKGGYIKDLKIYGKYTKSTTFSQVTIDTLSSQGWDQEGVRTNISSPDCGVAVEFATDPANYTGIYQPFPALTEYNIPGMPRSGSTALTFSGLAIQKNYIGFILTPSNQQNGEIIHLYASAIDYCKVAYAMCQAQSKQCEVKDFKSWGGVRTIFDNLNWGFRHGDGANTPVINGTNIAGFNYQLFDIAPYSFGANFDNIYAEGLFKLGMLSGNAAAMITNSTFDFQVQGPGVPSPDYYMLMNNVINENCIYRLYSGYNRRYRITLDGLNNEFKGGQMNWPLVSHPRSDQFWYPRMIAVASYISNVKTNSYDYDSTGVQDHNYSTIHINKSNWTAWIKGSWVGNPATIQIGSIAVLDRFSLDHRIQQYDYIAGYVKSVAHDTVYLDNVGVGINDGENVAIRILTLKSTFDY